MKMKMVITNLRLPEEDWLQIKTSAGELGLSINEYIKELVQTMTLERELSGPLQKREKGYTSLWKYVNRKVKHSPKGLSDEDKTIYS